MGLSHAQEVALAIAPKVGGGISILGSLWIFWDILTSREKRQQVYHRIMFMISSFDIIVSSGAFSSTWPMTEDTDPWKGRGSDTTCKIQGFAMQLGGTLFTYNAALSVFYVLMIVFHLKEELLKKYEWTLHIVPLTFGISTATIAMGMDWYHNANLWCWIAVDPACSDELYASLNVEYCSRYNNIWIFRWAFFFAPLWACFAVQIASMMVVLRTVHHQEARTKENTQKISHHQEPDIMSESDNSEEAEIQSVSPPGDREEAHPDCVEQSDKPLEKQEFRRTRQVATQAVLYICAFYMTYFFATLNRILQQVRGSSPYIVLLMHTLSLPQQGFWNFLIYRRPHYLQLRRKKYTRWQAMWNAAIITYYQTEDPSGTPGPPRRSSRNRPFSHKSSRWGAKNPRNPSANLQREHTRVAAGNSWNVNLSTVSQVQPGHTDQTEIKDGTAVIKRATHVIKPAAPRNNRRPARNNVRFSELVSESMAEITSFQLSSETGGEFFSRQGGNDSIKNMKSSLKRGCEQECVSESEEPLDDLESKLSNHMQRLSSWDRATANTVDQDRSAERSNDEETISSSKESEPNGLHN